ncbi:MAG: DUF1684 domain-containing protein [Candidatus Promineifilaceae bacterium]|jgi:uncharacterized protein (DUF1684 family)
MNELAQFRVEVDDFMQFHNKSPLDNEQRDVFEGLQYFPENDDLNLEVEVERFSEDEPLMEMTTNTGEQRRYRRWGRFTFQVDGEEAALTVYSDPYGEELFLPFRDVTSEQESYGAGRYMDNYRPGLRHLPDGRLEVDFNYAYNPYCAYSEYYSCPLPPAENWLKVPIRAGEKKFK